MTMAENGVEDEMISAEEKLNILHRKERKELQAKIQNMKHAVPKGDKKRRKELSSEIALLEMQLDEKHANELAQLKNNLELKNVENGVNEIKIDAANGVVPEKPHRLSKAQRRRERKSNQEKDREERIAQEMLQNAVNPRSIEAKKLKEITKKRNLAIYEIPSDGNCMYKAFGHQMKLIGVEVSVDDLRSKTAEYMLAHADDFLPFLTSQKTGDMMTSDEFEEYCKEVASTTAWGGQIELRALSHVYGVCIEVIQADGPSIFIGEEYGDKPVTLSYHRHAYGLGEHYNSIIPYSPENDEEEGEEDDDATATSS